MCSAGPCPIALASGQSASGVIAVDAASVYWASRHDGTVMKAPVAGGAPAVLASGQNSPDNITVDSTNIYWTAANSEVWTASLGGGTGVFLASQPAYGLVVNHTSLYGTGDGTVWQMPVGGGLVTLDVEPVANPLGSVAVDATSVYFTNPSARTILKVPIRGGMPLTLASGQNGLAHIAVDSTSIYWTATNDGTVIKAPLAGGAAVTLALLQSYPTGIAVDDASVYWTNYAGAGSCALGAVMKVPLGGGTPTVIASGQLFPDGIAVDATSVYWTTGVSRDLSVFNGAVMKLTPK